MSIHRADIIQPYNTATTGAIIAHIITIITTPSCTITTEQICHIFITQPYKMAIVTDMAIVLDAHNHLPTVFTKIHKGVMPKDIRDRHQHLCLKSPKLANLRKSKQLRIFIQAYNMDIVTDTNSVMCEPKNSHGVHDTKKE
jgi:hypothetical protein